MTEANLEHAQLLLKETREELGKADAKVSILLATSGVAASIAFGSVAAGHRIPSHLALWAETLWWIGVSASLVGIAILGTTLVPHISHQEGKSAVRYFGHVSEFSSPAELMEALQCANDPRLERTVDQLWVVSRLVIQKYRRIRYALFAFALAIISILIAAAG